ncbi:uncharacterized protein Triagg1_5435 [Trichoderma aggressivum f. europaeum]|uniref:Uncharacterized protein n=1 Tax=Trichoderma aggressivum f. europaeum TaxID=173218 RepID=A0AAE1M4V9_9HYPO|nr:hypothetical protein Triagg1_5435 [Trichoderma aggressivum f. europaeum]
MEEMLERYITAVKSDKSKRQQAKVLKDQVEDRKKQYKSNEAFSPEDMEGGSEHGDEGEESADEEFGLIGDE